MNTTIVSAPTREIPTETTLPLISPLEIHPSIPADLAELMLKVADLIVAKPEVYDGSVGLLDAHRYGGCGCILVHLCRIGNFHWTWLGDAQKTYPKHEWALGSLYIDVGGFAIYKNVNFALARIERFLRTAT